MYGNRPRDRQSRVNEERSRREPTRRPPLDIKVVMELISVYIAQGNGRGAYVEAKKEEKEERAAHDPGPGPSGNGPGPGPSGNGSGPGPSGNGPGPGPSDNGPGRHHVGWQRTILRDEIEERLREGRRREERRREERQREERRREVQERVVIRGGGGEPDKTSDKTPKKE